MKLTATQIAAACDGQFVVRAEDEAVCAYRLCWDSREVLPGDLYVALPGERVDGHDFVARAIEAGAVAALVMRPTDAETLALARTAGVAIIQVADTKQAIDDLACAWRAHLDCPIIGVTGSSGKTTTKNLIRDVLSTSMRVVATQGNQNNELGAPRTLLSADEDTEALVVEMGMHSAGEISHLCDIIRPDWGVIVSVGESHIEYLGSRENIARAKAELFCALAAGGHAFVNAADDFAEFVCDEAQLAARGVAVSAVDGTGEACVEEGWSKCASAPDGSVRPWDTEVDLHEGGDKSLYLHIA